MTAMLESPRAEDLRAHERYLYGIAYRMTGSASDAEDVVQETYARALERPHARRDEPLRPWLAAIAANLGRDVLRKRKRRSYHGMWLPSPIDTERAVEDLPAPEEGPRYDARESVSYAFMVALEALSSQQRAVLILRDVLDYSVRETADVLSLTEANVKVVHHRARKALEGYDATRVTRDAAYEERTARALDAFVTAMITDDVAGLEALLAEDARSVADGGGRYTASLMPIQGRSRVARMYVALARKSACAETAIEGRFAIVRLNGEPALVFEQPSGFPGAAPRGVIRLEVDAQGKVRACHSILAPEKLTGVARI